MTREEILAMKPGRELDEAVAIHVYGLTKPEGVYIWGVPSYSTNIGAAWGVVEKFDYLYIYKNKNQAAKFFCKPGQYECKLTKIDDGEHLGVGDSAQEAVCKAALLAVMDID